MTDGTRRSEISFPGLKTNNIPVFWRVVGGRWRGLATASADDEGECLYGPLSVTVSPNAVAKLGGTCPLAGGGISFSTADFEFAGSSATRGHCSLPAFLCKN